MLMLLDLKLFAFSYASEYGEHGKTFGGIFKTSFFHINSRAWIIVESLGIKKGKKLPWTDDKSWVLKIVSVSIFV